MCRIAIACIVVLFAGCEASCARVPKKTVIEPVTLTEHVKITDQSVLVNSNRTIVYGVEHRLNNLGRLSLAAFGNVEPDVIVPVRDNQSSTNLPVLAVIESWYLATFLWLHDSITREIPGKRLSTVMENNHNLPYLIDGRRPINIPDSNPSSLVQMELVDRDLQGISRGNSLASIIRAGFSQCIGGSLSSKLRSASALSSSVGLIRADYRSENSENDQSNLRFKYPALNRYLLPVIFLLLFFLGTAGGIFAIRWGGEDWDPPFIPKWGLFLIRVLVGQWGGLRLLEWFFGRIIRGDETRIPRRTEGRGEFREAGAGCFSGSPSGESEKASPQAYTPQKDRQRQGLERFLLPRPCLRRVAAGLFHWSEQIINSLTRRGSRKIRPSEINHIPGDRPHKNQNLGVPVLSKLNFEKLARAVFQP